MEYPLIKSIINKLESSATNFTDVQTDIATLSGCVNASKVGVTVSNFPTSQTISGSVNVNNFPSTQAISHASLTELGQNLVAANDILDSNSKFSLQAGTTTDDEVVPILVDSDGKVQVSTGDITISNFPATQTIAGAVSIADTLNVNVQNFPETQTVTGSVYASCSGTVAITSDTLTGIATAVATAGSAYTYNSSSMVPAGAVVNETFSTLTNDNGQIGAIAVDRTGCVYTKDQNVGAIAAASHKGGTGSDVYYANDTKLMAIAGLSNWANDDKVSNNNQFCPLTTNIKGNLYTEVVSLPSMYVPNGTNVLNSTSDKGNLGLTVEYGVGKFNPLVCNSTQRLLVADTDVKGVLETIASLLSSIQDTLTNIDVYMTSTASNTNNTYGILNTVFDDPNNLLRTRNV